MQITRVASTQHPEALFRDPLDIEVLELAFERFAGLLVRARHQGTHLKLPALTRLIGKHPAHLPQGLALAVLGDVVDPERDAVGILLLLDEDGDRRAAGLDVTDNGGGQRGDAPVGEAVAGDGGQDGRAVDELDAGLDPLAGCVGRVVRGEAEEEAGLVVERAVGRREGDCGGEEVRDGGDGVGAGGG